MKAIFYFVFSFLLLTSLPAAHADAAEVSQTQAVKQTHSTGEVRKIDLTNRKLTLKHGEIANLDMPPMTMVFVAKDKRLLRKLKVGDSVEFSAIKEQGEFVLTHVRKLKR
jgi:Cu(I)/Ag(I) efflux system periplasmic protein CusF